MQNKSIFIGRAHPDSDVGVMIKHGHHRSLFQYGGEVTLPGDRHCEDCGARCGSEAAAKICPSAEMVHVEVMRHEVNTIVDTIGKSTTGKKIRKKVNQLYGRGVKRLTEQEVEARLRDFDEKLMKPKPKYLPVWIWNMVKGMVLRDRINV